MKKQSSLTNFFQSRGTTPAALPPDPPETDQTVEATPAALPPDPPETDQTVEATPVAPPLNPPETAVSTPSAPAPLPEVRLIDISLAVGRRTLEQGEIAMFLDAPRWYPTATSLGPSSQHSYKRDNQGNVKIENRYVKKQHLDKYTWLTLSPDKQGFFCKTCVLFARGIRHKTSDVKFVTGPLTKFKDLAGNKGYLETHQNLTYHKDAYIVQENFKATLKTPATRIDNQISKEKKLAGEKNRAFLKPIVDTVLTLCKQNIAFRGHRGEEGCVDAEGTDPEANDGNFRSMLRMRIRSGDTALKDHSNSHQKNATFASADIQNEVIDLIKKLLLEKISDSVREAFCWAVMADDTSDKSSKELTAVCVRYVVMKEGVGAVINEDVVAVKDLISEIREINQLGDREEVVMSGLNIGPVILKALDSISLDPVRCVASCMDGAGSMSSERIGVAAVIKERSELADYYHCVLHKLNLVAASVIKDLTVQHAHASVSALITFFTSSPKRVDHLKKVIREHAPNAQKTHLITLCTTRFVERHEAILVVRDLLPCLLKSIEDMKCWKATETKTGALKQETIIRSSSFIIGMGMLEAITATLKPLTVKLQGKYIDLGQCMDLVAGVKNQLLDMRGTYWEEVVYPKLEAVCESIDGALTKPRRTRFRTYTEHQWQDLTVCQFYKKTWTGVIQNVLDDLNLKFGPAQQHISTLQLLVPGFTASKPLENEEIARILLTKYRVLFPGITETEFERELDRWQHRWAVEATKPDTPTEALSHCENFPTIKEMLLIFVTLPITSCEPERVFSKVNNTKTAIRSTMSSERLESLVLIPSHWNSLPSVKEIVDRFCLKPRRVYFGPGE